MKRNYNHKNSGLVYVYIKRRPYLRYGYLAVNKVILQTARCKTLKHIRKNKLMSLVSTK